MKILLLGDSHCRDLDSIFKEISSSYVIYTVSTGDQLDAIATKFRNKVQSIIRFDPDSVILHGGHNDMARHPRYNRRPQVSKPTARKTMQLAREVHSYLPSAKIFVSNVFPRTFTDRSILSQSEVHKYNETSKRHGPQLRALTGIEGFNMLINDCMWLHISSAQEESSHFLIDGLHLNKSGQLAVVREWLSYIHSPLTS